MMWSIWNNSFLNCGCRWKWRMIIAVIFFFFTMLAKTEKETYYESHCFPSTYAAVCLRHKRLTEVHAGNFVYDPDTYWSWLLSASKRISLDAGYSIMSSVKLRFIWRKSHFLLRGMWGYIEFLSWFLYFNLCQSCLVAVCDVSPILPMPTNWTMLRMLFRETQATCGCDRVTTLKSVWKNYRIRRRSWMDKWLLKNKGVNCSVRIWMSSDTARVVTPVWNPSFRTCRPD